jgi:hypothetical protein
MVTRMWAKQSRVQYPGEARIFFIVQDVHIDSGAQPFTKSLDTEGSFLRGEAAGGEVDHSPSAEVKNVWSYTPTPIYAFMAGTETTWFTIKTHD